MRHGFRVFLKIFKYLLFLSRKLLHALDEALIKLFLRHINFVFAANFGQHEAGANTTLGNLFIFGAQIIFAFIKVVHFLTLLFQFVLELLPNLFKFQRHHRGRQLEAMAVAQLVEQVFFQVPARHLTIVIADLVTNGLAQLFKAFHAQRGCKFLVNLCIFGRADLVHRNLENAGLTSQFRIAIFFRKRHFNVFRVACFGADKLVFEAGNKLPRPQFQFKAFGRTTFKSFPINAPDKVDFDAVAFLRFGSFATRLEILAR